MIKQLVICNYDEADAENEWAVTNLEENLVRIGAIPTSAVVIESGDTLYILDITREDGLSDEALLQVFKRYGFVVSTMMRENPQEWR